MTVMKDEIFGPVIGIQKVASEDEAVRLANDSHLGLNAYVFTKDREKGRRLAERIQAGSVVVNDVLVNYAMPETPFGGIKQSGFGRVHGEDALRDLAEARHVNLERFPLPQSNPMTFPYTEKTYGFVRKMLRTLYSGRGLVQRVSQLF
jgi:succinate-semialdehyde dehydrogenase/glutarate-semialdehyde dehydrogenase